MENKRKNIRTVLCCVFYAHTYEQFLPVTVGVRFSFLHLFSILCVFFWFMLDYFVLLLFPFVVLALILFSTMPRDWLGGTSPM